MIDKLIFQTAPAVNFGSNIFQNCPTILQFDETPLISVVKVEEIGFSTEVPIFHEDGTFLAKVVGSQLYSTDAGKKAGVELHHPDKMTVCKMGDKTLFEVRREDAASLKTAAELYTPEGYFVKYSDGAHSIISSDGGSLNIGGIVMTGNMFSGCRIGVLLKSDGSCAIGVN